MASSLSSERRSISEISGRLADLAKAAIPVIARLQLSASVLTVTDLPPILAPVSTVDPMHSSTLIGVNSPLRSRRAAATIGLVISLMRICSAFSQMFGMAQPYFAAKRALAIA